VEADRKREEERRLKRAIGQRRGRYLAEILLEHPGHAKRSLGTATAGLPRSFVGGGLPSTPSGSTAFARYGLPPLTQDFHLSLKRTARRPKPNPLLQMVLLAGDKADLRALLLRQREPEPFEPLYTDFTLLPYRGGKAWFVPILGQPLERLRSP